MNYALFEFSLGFGHLEGVENKVFEEELVKTSPVKAAQVKPSSKPNEPKPLKIELPAEKQRIATPETAKKPGTGIEIIKYFQNKDDVSDALFTLS